jgi:hypothetical protein
VLPPVATQLDVVPPSRQLRQAAQPVELAEQVVPEVPMQVPSQRVSPTQYAHAAPYLEQRPVVPEQVHTPPAQSSVPQPVTWYSLGLPAGSTQVPPQQYVLVPSQPDPSAPVQSPQVPPADVQAWQEPPHSPKSPAERLTQAPLLHRRQLPTQVSSSARLCTVQIPLSSTLQAWHSPQEACAQHRPSTQLNPG